MDYKKLGEVVLIVLVGIAAVAFPFTIYSRLNSEPEKPLPVLQYGETVKFKHRFHGLCSGTVVDFKESFDGKCYVYTVNAICKAVKNHSEQLLIVMPRQEGQCDSNVEIIEEEDEPVKVLLPVIEIQE